MIETESASPSRSSVCYIFNKAEQLFNILSKSVHLLDWMKLRLRYGLFFFLRLNFGGTPFKTEARLLFSL